VSERLTCRHHGGPRGCPGCPLLGEPYSAQLERKAARLEAALSRYPHLALPAPEAIVPAVRTRDYRHRLKLPVDLRGARPRIGLYDADHRVLDTPDCPVLAPALRDALPPLMRWLAGRQGVHSVDLRASAKTGELYLVLACAGGAFPGGAKAARQLRRDLPGLVGIAVSRADPSAKRVMGSAPRLLAGSAWLREAIGETDYRLHPGAFFQVDPLQAERIHDLVRQMVGGARTVLDLYAGVGAYGLMLAPGRERVVLVEEVPQAAAGAAAVAPANVRVIAGRVEDQPLEGHRFDAAVINPARRGSDPRALGRLAGLVDRAVYVSCGPETLARDLDCLAAHGLRAARIVPVDLFPQTGEVETVVALERGPPVARWRGAGGWAQSPWLARGSAAASGAPGRAVRAMVLVLGDARASGTVDGARFERVGTVAGHSLLRLELGTTLERALAGLRARGLPLAGADPRSRGFFAEKAGLVRPFVHVERDADGNEAPLHGDLAEAIARLGGISHRPRPRRSAVRKRPRRR
jgi:23S rRNA (uracil1939-C5)-methyltransferase